MKRRKRIICVSRGSNIVHLPLLLTPWLSMIPHLPRQHVDSLPSQTWDEFRHISNVDGRAFWSNEGWTKLWLGEDGIRNRSFHRYNDID